MASDTYGAILLTTANDVGAMLQKKMVTPSETYAPAVWANTINLLGKLPEKTVSFSPIVTFSDGADDVPLKSCEVSLPASLDGYSSVDVVQTGKNLLKNQETSRTESDVTFTKNSDGSVSLSGTASADINYTIYSNFEFPKLGQYVISGCPLGGSTSTYRIFATNYGSDTGSGLSVNVTNLSTKTSIRINIKSGTNINGLTFKPMVEVGSSASAFEKYSAPTTHTASLGRTIYSGSVDVVKGEGTDENGNDFTFESVEISSKLGSNTMWSDGDMNVTYRRDIDLALQTLSGSRGLMMARPPAAAETEETEPEDETTETIEETPEDMEK